MLEAPGAGVFRFSEIFLSGHMGALAAHVWMGMLLTGGKFQHRNLFGKKTTQTMSFSLGVLYWRLESPPFVAMGTHGKKENYLIIIHTDEISSGVCLMPCSLSHYCVCLSCNSQPVKCVSLVGLWIQIYMGMCAGGQYFMWWSPWS